MKPGMGQSGGRAAGVGAMHRAAGISLAALVLQACAIHYYDPQTQTEHVWGFGHMAQRVTEPREGVRAIVRGLDTLGIGIGSVPGQTYLIAGWQSIRRVEVVDESTQVRFDWPASDFFSVRVGSEHPFNAGQEPGSPAQDGDNK